MHIQKGKRVKGLTGGDEKRLPGKDLSVHMSNFSTRVEQVLNTFLSFFKTENGDNFTAHVSWEGKEGTN